MNHICDYKDNGRETNGEFIIIYMWYAGGGFADVAL